MSKWNQPLAPFDFPSPPIWAIARLIRDTIGNDRKQRSAVIHGLGYSKPERAALRFDHLIRTGECSKELRAHLPQALGAEVDVVEQAFAETERQRAVWQEQCARHAETRDRLNFVPRLALLHDRANRRVPIFVLSLFGPRRLTWVEIPEEVLALDYEEQIRELPGLLEVWQQTTDGRHSTDWLGKPVGFLYKPENDMTVRLDAGFRLEGVHDGPLPESQFTLKAQNLDLLRVLGLGSADL